MIPANGSFSRGDILQRDLGEWRGNRQEANTNRDGESTHNNGRLEVDQGKLRDSAPSKDVKAVTVPFLFSLVVLDQMV